MRLLDGLLVQRLQSFFPLHERVEAQDEVVETCLDMTGQILDALHVFFDFVSSFFELGPKLLVCLIELSQLIANRLLENVEFLRSLSH